MGRIRIPTSRTRVETRVSNSRFITTVIGVDSAAAAHDAVRAIRAEMPDATHHVYSFRIGGGASVIEGLSDDGEPSGTAGPPTLAVLRGSGLGDVLLVTTRYFGGTKLGTGGLVSAYAAAAKNALAATPTQEKVQRIAVEMVIEYRRLETVRRLLAELDGVHLRESFDEAVHLRAEIPAELWSEFEMRMMDLTKGRSRPHQV